MEVKSKLIVRYNMAVSLVKNLHVQQHLAGTAKAFIVMINRIKMETFVDPFGWSPISTR